MQLIGRASVRRADSTTVDIPASLKPLLGYLCVEPIASCHRERVIEALWPALPADVGRRRLNTVVWRSRALFGTDRDEVLRVSRDGLMYLDKRRISVDVVNAVRGVSQATRADAMAGTADAINLLQRTARMEFQHFLVGCYHDWVVQARDELGAGVISVLETLVSLATTTDEAISWTELLVKRDPLREDAHRRLIALYAKVGRRGDALDQYDICRRRLRDELGVVPLVETSLLAAAVRAEVPQLDDDSRQIGPALSELRDALASCRSAVEQIERVLTDLSRGLDIAR